MNNDIFVTRSQVPDRRCFDRYMDRVFASGWFTNRGQLVRELEERLAHYLGVRNLILVGNGTLALQVAYKALGLSGQVVTSPFTFIATASSAVWEGLEVRFADIDAETFNLDIDSIRKNIGPRTSAIVPVHVFGNPCDVQAIEQVAKEFSLKVIYDAAHAFAIRLEEESVLNYGDVSTLSFHATKLFHTVEGGAIIVQDDELCTKIRKMINFGITGYETIDCLGINAKMNEVQAAVGLCLLDEIEGTISRRRALASIYDEILGNAVARQKWHQDASANHTYYPVLFESEQVTKRVQERLNSENIFPRRYFYPSLSSLSFITTSSVVPVAEDIASRILCLPLYADLTEDECRRVAHVCLAALEA